MALLAASHPVPGAAVTAVTLILSLALGLEPWRVVVLTLTMAANQLTVGWSNDAIDADRDRTTGRTDKPVARGEIDRRRVATASVIGGIAALVLPFVLGAAAGVVHAVFLISALAYNAGLKSTAVSVLPYVVSFGLLPALVTLSAAEPRAAAWWAVVAGALLGVAAHFANVLPDLEDDRRTGVRGLPHRLGLLGAGTSAFAALAVGAVVVALGVRTPAGTAGAVLVVLVAVLGSVLVVRHRITRLLFGLVLIAALILVAMLASSGASVSL